MKSISFLEQLVQTRRFTLGVPGQFTVAPDGAFVLFLRSRAGDDPVACLWALDLDSGLERLIADPAELLAGRGDPARVPTDPAERAAPPTGGGIGGYATDAAARRAAFALGGALWVVDVASGRARCLPAAGPVADPRPDPAGWRIAYASAGALRVIEADGTRDRAIAEPDGKDVTFGVAEQAGIVSLRGTRGFWWSPDGDRLLVARVDLDRGRTLAHRQPGRPWPCRRGRCVTRLPGRPTPRSRCGWPGWTARGPRSAGTGTGSSTCRASAGTTTAPTPWCSPATSAPSGSSASTRTAARPPCWPSSATSAGSSWSPACPRAPAPAPSLRTPTCAAPGS